MKAKQDVKKESKEYINSTTIKYIIKEMKTSDDNITNKIQTSKENLKVDSKQAKTD